MVPKLLSLLLLVMLCECVDVSTLKLKQVLILSRPNIRYPIKKPLSRYSSKPWSESGEAGLLTPRGAQLEGYMGEYFSEWFKKEHFLPDGCPEENTVYVYSNNLNRTIATAKAFVKSAFKNCTVPVHYSTAEQDPLFEILIQNTTEDKKNKVFDEIRRRMDNNSKLKEVYAELNEIFDIKHSEICKTDSICDLTKSNNTILYEDGQVLWITGPLLIGNLAVDSFMMSFYDGMPLEDIAWGKITTPEKWKLLTEIGRQEQYIRVSPVVEHFGAPLLTNITNTFKNYNYNDMPKLMLIMGHDYNLNSISIGLGFKSIGDLPNTYDPFPIGGKLVFQRWTDEKENDYLKIEYIYPTWFQARNATELTLDNPPQRVTMQLNWCNTDKDGFCEWNEFVNKLQNDHISKSK